MAFRGSGGIMYAGTCASPVLAVPVCRWSSRLQGTTTDIGGGEKNSSDKSDEAGKIWAGAQLPMRNAVQVEQATRAVWQALADGKTRQILRLSLPLIGATEMDDWPGGDRQRYKAVQPMVDKLLRGNPAAQVRVSLFATALDISNERSTK